ncbi:MAG: hypothetical protein ABI476_02640 [Oxalobacteraceae bacterium]
MEEFDNSDGSGRPAFYQPRGLQLPTGINAGGSSIVWRAWHRGIRERCGEKKDARRRMHASSPRTSSISTE